MDDMWAIMKLPKEAFNLVSLKFDLNDDSGTHSTSQTAEETITLTKR